jgi:hypothetical protein
MSCDLVCLSCHMVCMSIDIVSMSHNIPAKAIENALEVNRDEGDEKITGFSGLVVGRRNQTKPCLMLKLF